MKVALAQINFIVGNIEHNVKKIIAFGRQAKNNGAQLVIFSELAICGYPPMDLLLKESFVKANLSGLNEIASVLPDITVIVGFVDRNKGEGKVLRNACAVLEDGLIKAVQYKTLLPSYDVFDEGRYFEPASNYVVPSIGGLKVGLSICEDIWRDQELCPNSVYAKDPVAKIAELKPEVLINIAASPYSANKENIRYELIRQQAKTMGIPVAYVNQIGGNDELIFDGRSMLVSAKGDLIARANAYAEDLLIADLYQGGTIKESPEDVTVNVHDALVLGTKDYLQKCGFKKAVVGLSGGIDSAVVCALSCEAVGAESILGIAMPSPYSSTNSLTDAKHLAGNLGVKLEVIPIEKSMLSLYADLSPLFAGLGPDVAEENIQARLRGIILMSLSNKFGYLVLTTGNKSELAVGYCTLYGDMCGGLAVISDVPKMLVYDLARFINEKAGKPIIPQAIIEKPPSAELKLGQKDTDTLPAYVLLDGIIHAYVELRYSPAEIIKLGYNPDIVMDVIERIDRNEYKRHQAAPGLKVMERSFGCGWRMPIAQGFKERLEDPKPL